MELIIKEAKSNKLLLGDEEAHLLISNYSELYKINSIEDIFKYLISNDKSFILLDELSINLFYQYVIGKTSEKENERVLKENKETISILIYYKQKYEELKNNNITEITIICSKNNNRPIHNFTSI